MTDKSVEGPDTSPMKPASESESQEAAEREMSEASPPVPQRVIEEHIEQVIAGAIGPVRNPVLDKFTSDHITDIIRNDSKNDERDFQDSKANRRYRLAYVLIGLISFFVLTFPLLSIDKELYKQVLQVLAVFAGGFGAGYGIRRWRE